MKPRRLSELRTLLAHPDFQSWWEALQKARNALAAARAQYEELLSQTTLTEFRAELTQKNAIDTLYRAGELEDTAATLAAEAQEIENESLRVVSHFEEQRYKASEFWYRLGAAEKTRDEAAEALKKTRTKRTEADLEAAERTVRSASEAYDREFLRRNELWDEVERLWTRSAEVSLLVSEHKLRGRRIRREAETLFTLAEERKLRGRALRHEAEQASAAVDAAEREIKQLLDGVRERFGCANGSDFLYFRLKDHPKLAYAVSLIEDLENFNVEVWPLGIYSVDRQRGVSFLEPARMENPSLEDGDRRFEEYFLQGRKGEVRAVGA